MGEQPIVSSINLEKRLDDPFGIMITLTCVDSLAIVDRIGCGEGRDKDEMGDRVVMTGEGKIMGMMIFYLL